MLLQERKLVPITSLKGDPVVADVEKTFKLVPNIKHLNISISTSDQMIQGKFQVRAGKIS